MTFPHCYYKAGFICIYSGTCKSDFFFDFFKNFQSILSTQNEQVQKIVIYIDWYALSLCVCVCVFSIIYIYVDFSAVS